MSDTEARTLLFSYITIGLFQDSKETRAQCFHDDLKRLNKGDNLETIIKDRDIAYNIPKKSTDSVFRLKCGICNRPLDASLDCRHCDYKIGSVIL